MILLIDGQVPIDVFRFSDLLQNNIWLILISTAVTDIIAWRKYLSIWSEIIAAIFHLMHNFHYEKV